MPAKNSLKKYVENGFYHIYNRGVEKRTIFEDKQDYGVFLSYLKNYLTPKDINLLQQNLASTLTTWHEKDQILKLVKLNNFSENIKLLAYCLMPNHLHLLVKQTEANAIDRFINSLNTRYVMYFNKKHKRVGPLFQGVYKAVLVETDEQLLHLSAYIHRNPIKSSRSLLTKDNYLRRLTCQPSSLPDYFGMLNTAWLDTKPILSFFRNKSSISSYREFVVGNDKSDFSIKDLTIDK